MLHELPSGNHIDLLTIKTIRAIDRSLDYSHIGPRVVVDYVLTKSRWGDDHANCVIISFGTLDEAKRYALELATKHNEAFAAEATKPTAWRFGDLVRLPNGQEVPGFTPNPGDAFGERCYAAPNFPMATTFLSDAALQKLADEIMAVDLDVEPVVPEPEKTVKFREWF